MQVSANSPRIDPQQQQQQQSGRAQAVPPRQGAGSFAAALEDAQQAPGAAKPAGQAAAMPAVGSPAPGRLL